MSEARRHPNIINRDEAPVVPMEKGKHRIRMQQLGRPAGASTLGGNVSEVAPHSISFPFHYHCATEEALFVLSGSGLARIGDERVRVRAGDWISYPPGPVHAHQMINDTDEPLLYLAISALAVKVDVVGYPDSKKVAASAGTLDKPLHRFIAREGESLDYWLDEPDAS